MSKSVKFSATELVKDKFVDEATTDAMSRVSCASGGGGGSHTTDSMMSSYTKQIKKITGEMFELRQDLKAMDKQLTASRTEISDLTQKLEAAHSTISRFESEPGEYILNVYCPQNEVIFKFDSAKLFRLDNGAASRWATMHELAECKAFLEKNPHYKAVRNRELSNASYARHHKKKK